MMIIFSHSSFMPVTFQQEQFCLHFAEFRDGPAAYRHAYNVRPDTVESSISVGASKLLADHKIQERLSEISTAMTLAIPTLPTIAGTLEYFETIANADPDELIGLRVGCCRRCYGIDHGYQWKDFEYREALRDWEHLPEKTRAATPMPDFGGGLGFNHTLPPAHGCPECRGEGVERIVARDTSKLSKGARALYGGVKKTNRGIEVIIADRVKAKELVGRIQGAYKDGLNLAIAIRPVVTAQQIREADPIEAERLYREYITANSV